MRRDDPERNPPDVHGHQLFPLGRIGNQPLYAILDIKAFIAGVKAADPGMRPAGLTWYVFDDTPGVPWRWRRMRRCARLVKRPTHIGAPRASRAPKAEPGTAGHGPALI
jgi:hypothetical protein